MSPASFYHKLQREHTMEIQKTENLRKYMQIAKPCQLDSWGINPCTDNNQLQQYRANHKPSSCLEVSTTKIRSAISSVLKR